MELNTRPEIVQRILHAIDRYCSPAGKAEETFKELPVNEAEATFHVVNHVLVREWLSGDISRADFEVAIGEWARVFSDGVHMTGIYDEAFEQLSRARELVGLKK